MNNIFTNLIFKDFQYVKVMKKLLPKHNLWELSDE
jgi:hypothetical protein